MKQIIVFCLMLASLALAQQRQIVVVLPSVADDDAKLTPNQLNALTEEVRNVVTKTLPQKDFLLMKQDEVMEALGEDAFFKACDEKTCLGSLMEKVQANFGARCDVYIVDKQLRLKFELYGTPKGESKARTIGQFTKKARDFAEMEAVIKKEVPPIFDLIGKTEQERCLDTPGKMWVDGDCITGKELAQKDCLQKSGQGYVWDGEDCRSREEISCKNRKGYKWEGNECKSPAWQECDKKGWDWVNEKCSNPAVAPAIAPAMGGGYVAKIVTEPAGATLNLNGVPYQGCTKTPCSILLYQNSVRLSAILNDYDTADTAITITMPNQVVDIKLKPKTYAVSFTSEPSGASLTLEGYGKCETPCRMFLAKGGIKVTAGLMYYDRKDTTVAITGSSNQQIDLKLSPNYGTLDINGASSDWNFKVGDKSLPLDNIRLLPGSYTAKLTNYYYEDIDFIVDIKKNERKSYDISDKIVPRFGYLKINRSYLSGIGNNEDWHLMIGNEHYSLGEVKLLHGEHQVRLTHSCYEDINFKTKIERNGRTSFDMQDKVALKQGTLVLRAKRKMKNLSMPVYVDGKQVGETPFEGSVPICSKVRIGNEGKENVYVKPEHNEAVEYIYKDDTFKSHLLGAVFDVTGAVFLVQSMAAWSDRAKYRKDYVNMEKGDLTAFDKAWKKEEDAHSKGNTFLIIGGAALVLGIGVHVWF